MEKLNIVKIGSAGITAENIKKLLEDIELFKKQTGEKTILVSSGAVKLGKQLVLNEGKDLSIFTDASLASIGQSHLIAMYRELSNELVGQILIDDYANSDYVKTLISKLRQTLGKIKINGILDSIVNKVLHLINDDKDKHLVGTIQNLIKNEALIVINHNDALSSSELKGLTEKTDNDKNVVYLADIFSRFGEEYKIRINRVIYLTDKNGVLDDSGKTFIPEIVEESNIEYNRKYALSFLQDKKSNDGTGGMGSKINGSFDCLSLGVREAIIANIEAGLDFLLQKNQESKITKFSLQIAKTK